MIQSFNERVIIMYQAGKTIKEIAEETNYTFNHIYNILRLENIKLRKRGESK